MNSTTLRLIGHAAFAICLGPHIFNARGEPAADASVIPSALHEEAAAATLYANERNDAMRRMTDASLVGAEAPSGATTSAKGPLFGNSVYNPTPCHDGEAGRIGR